MKTTTFKANIDVHGARIFNRGETVTDDELSAKLRHSLEIRGLISVKNIETPKPKPEPKTLKEKSPPENKAVTPSETKGK